MLSCIPRMALAAVALLVVALASCGDSTDEGDLLVEVNTNGAIFFGGPDSEPVVFDDTTTVAAGGEVSKTSPNGTGFSDYKLPREHLTELERLLDDLDLDQLKAQFPPRDDREGLTLTISHEDRVASINVSNLPYDGAESRQVLALEDFQSLIDEIGRMGYREQIGPLPYEDPPKLESRSAPK